MPQFTLICTDEDETTTTKEFESTILQDAVEKTADFLKGVGYVFEDLHVQTHAIPEKDDDDYVKSVYPQFDRWYIFLVVYFWPLTLSWAKPFGVVVTNEVTTLLENPSVTNDNVEQIDTQPRTTIMANTTTENPKQIEKTENLTQKSTMTMDGIDEIESFYEDLEFDDASAVDYDLDFTTQS